MNPREAVFEVLKALDIQYQLVNHPAVFNIEDTDRLKLSQYGEICKNLFLRDASGKRHFLVVLDKDKKANLKDIQKQIGCSSLSFASEKRLFKFLQLQKGEVTPFGILNDPNAAVEVVLDSELSVKDKLGFHPNDNTATLWISFEALVKIIKHNGNFIHMVNI